jgi:hypothetical protein
VLLLPAATRLNEQIKAALNRRHVACHLVEYPTAETIKTAVALRMGVTILPTSAVQDELRSGTLSARSITGWPGATRVIQLLVRAEGRPPRQAAAFSALIRQHSRRAQMSDVVHSVQQHPDCPRLTDTGPRPSGVFIRYLRPGAAGDSRGIWFLTAC